MPVNLNAFESPSTKITAYQVSIQELLSLNISKDIVEYLTKEQLKQELYYRFVEKIQKELWAGITKMVDGEADSGDETYDYGVPYYGDVSFNVKDMLDYKLTGGDVLYAATKKFPFLLRNVSHLDYNIFLRKCLEKATREGTDYTPSKRGENTRYQDLIIEMNDKFRMTWEEIAEVVEEWSVDSKVKEKK